MNIKLSESFKIYHSKKGFSAVTVNASSSGGSCCRITVPKVMVGEPNSALDDYNIFESEGITFYISKNLAVKETVTFSYETFLGQEMLEMKGFEIKHFYNS